MAVKDISLDEDLELVVKDGDFKITDSDTTHIELVLRANLGSFKQFPLVGMGIDNELASSGGQQVIKRKISVQLNLDGYKVTDIILSGTDEYQIDAKRIKLP
jgi:hypothetical protein